MTSLFTRLVVLALALAGATALVVTPVAAAPKVISSSGATLTVEVGKGKLVHLEHPASSVFIADPDIADLQVMSPGLVYVFGKAGGESNLFAVGENDEVIASMAVRVRYDVARVQEAIRQLAPRSAVAVSSVDDNLVLEGTVYSAAEGDDIRRVTQRFMPDPKQLINRLKVDAPNQINIRVRVAEVSRGVVKELGVNWDNLFAAGSNVLFGVATGHVTALTTGFPAIFNTRTAVPGSPTLDTVNNITGQFRVGGQDLNVLIDALDKQGLVTVLAEPNLTAVSGEPASFLAGGEFPVPVPQSTGFGGQITITWKKFGVSLDFVATLAANNRISLHVQPEVSQLSAQGSITLGNVQVPALTVRRAETTVDLASGQSLVIAGLMQNNINQTIARFPWLGDVPVLGQLFRSQTFLRNESELVVIATPYIVRPVATANRLMAPTDGFTPSTDKDLMLFGEEYQPGVLRRGAAPAGRNGNALIGPVGFDLE